MNKVVRIYAENHKDALAKGAKMFNVPISQFKENALLKKSGKNAFQITYSNNDIDNTATDTDSLFDKLESELTDIETNEIISGMTSEEMHEKGFIGENELEKPRPKCQEKQVEKGYTFLEGIDYYSSSLYQNINDLPFEDIEHINDTMPNQIVAYKNSKVVYTKKEDFNSTLFHDKKYLESCNLKVSYQNNNVMYSSLKKGKVVLLRDLIYIVPSDRDSYFKIRVAPNKMFTEADFYPSKGSGRRLSLGFFRSELLAKKILFGIKTDIIKENIEIAEESGECLKNIIIAEGKEPVDGSDAEVSLNFSQESIIDDFKILPDGRVDYRKQARIQVVKKGELLATVTEPEKGVEGKDVFGNTIKAKDGDIKVLYAGTNVEKSKNGLEFYATSDGQPVLNKNILNVLPHYHVPGDVDYSTGNIEFEGNVTIKGNVLPGFEVKATGDILVMGNIDNGIVDAGRDIKVLGGIIGNNENITKCGRNLNALHLQNAYLEVQGDVIIKDSVLHSKIYSTGNVILREGKGAIVGGLITTLRSVDAKSIGSRTGTKSNVTVGQDFLVQKKCEEFIEAQEFCKKNIEKIEKFLKPLLKLIKSGQAIDENKRERLMLIMKKHRELKEHDTMMEAKIKELKKAAQSNEKAMIKVKDIIYPDVTITIKSLSKLIQDEFTFVNFKIDREETNILKSSYN